MIVDLKFYGTVIQIGCTKVSIIYIYIYTYIYICMNIIYRSVRPASFQLEWMDDSRIHSRPDATHSAIPLFSSEVVSQVPIRALVGGMGCVVDPGVEEDQVESEENSPLAKPAELRRALADCFGTQRAKRGQRC